MYKVIILGFIIAVISCEKYLKEDDLSSYSGWNLIKDILNK